MSDLLDELAELERLAEPATAAELERQKDSLADWAQGVKLDHVFAFVERVLIPVAIFNTQASSALRGIQQARVALRKACPGIKTYPGELPRLRV